MIEDERERRLRLKRISNKRWRDKNRERCIELSLNWRKRNPEKHKQYRTKYRKNKKYIEYQKKWEAKFGFKKRETRRQRDINHPELYKNWKLLRDYKIDLEEYNKLLKSQNYLCAICQGSSTTRKKNSEEQKRLDVDHCHTTGKVRGLLCGSCNKGLGFFKDNLDNLKKAILYLSQ